MNFLFVILQKYELNIAAFLIVVLETHTPSEQTVDNFPSRQRATFMTASDQSEYYIAPI